MKPQFQLKDVVILSFILFIALLFRLYKIGTPLADFHSWRQADTAAVARNFVKDGIDLLHPRYDDLSGRESGRENPNGYRMVEFPIYNAIIAFSYKILPILPLEIYGRMTSVAFSLLIITVIYYLLKSEVNRLAAMGASLLYAVFPFFVFFSRVILPETTALGFTFLSIFFLYIYSRKNISRLKSIMSLFLSLVLFSLGILVKPTVIFYGIVLFYLFFRKYGFNIPKKFSFYVYFIGAAIPFIIWRIYIRNFPEGVPVSDWLITSVNTYEGLKNIFLRPAFFRWIFFERINNIIFGGFASFFFVLGISKKSKTFFFHFFLIASLAYLFTFQGGNVQHEYYQTIILPALAIFSGIGIEFIFNKKLANFFYPYSAHIIAGVIFISSFFFSYYRVRDYYNYPRDLAKIAKIIETLTKESEKVVTDTTGDSTLLYLSKRKGAPALYKDPQTLKELGYSHMVIFNKNYIKDLKSKQFTTVFEDDNFALFTL